MSLEAAIATLTAAVEANTAALLGKSGGGKSSAGADDDGAKTSTRRRTSTKSDDKPKYTADDVKAAAVKVKEELGTKAAKDLIKDHGADELAKLKPAVFADFIEAAGKLLAGDDDGGDDDGDDKDEL